MFLLRHNFNFLTYITYNHSSYQMFNSSYSSLAKKGSVVSLFLQTEESPGTHFKILLQGHRYVPLSLFPPSWTSTWKAHCSFFSLLPSGRRAHTSRLKNSFIHKAVRKLNSLPFLTTLPPLFPPLEFIYG